MRNRCWSSWTSKHSGSSKEIKEKNAISEELDGQLKKALDDFKGSFNLSPKPMAF